MKAVLYDFHGTLVNVRGVRSLLSDGDYEGFYRASLECPPIRSTVLAARQSHEAGYANLLFTGMPMNHNAGLVAWLEVHGVPIDYIDMRPVGDRRKDFVVKNLMYLRALGLGYSVTRAWDDSPHCLDLWKSQGLPIVRVPGWDPCLTPGSTAERVDSPPLAP